MLPEFPLGGARKRAPAAKARNYDQSFILLGLVMVEEFLSLRVRDTRGVRAFRTTTGRSWADPAPKHQGGIGGRGPGLSYPEGCRKRTPPSGEYTEGELMNVPGRPIRSTNSAS